VTAAAPRRTLVIAELSANHGGDLERTRDTIRAMHDAGADAVKLQTYRPSSLTLDLSEGPFAPLPEGPWKGWRPYDLFEEGALPYAWHEELFALGRELGMTVFSTPFDLEGLALLEQLECPIYKVASLEIAHVPLLEAIAATGKPVVLSTGAATLGDVELALEVLGRDRDDVTLLTCTTAYPTPMEEVHLRSMPALAHAFGLPVGLSDHTVGHTVAVAAVALGATMVEKHFVLDRAQGGIDAPFSMEPGEFRALVDAVRATEAALGPHGYHQSPSSVAARRRGRSIFVAEPVAAGAALTDRNLRVVRPGAGLHPRHFREVLGRTARVDLEPGTPLAWHHLERDAPLEPAARDAEGARHGD